MGKSRSARTLPSEGKQTENKDSSQMDVDKNLILEFFQVSRHSIELCEWWDLWRQFKETIDKLESIEMKLYFSYQFLADFDQGFLPGGTWEQSSPSYYPDPRRCRQQIQIEIEMWEKQLALREQNEESKNSKGGDLLSGAMSVVPKINWMGTLIDLVRLLEIVRTSGKVGHSTEEMVTLTMNHFHFRGNPIQIGSLKNAISKARQDARDDVEYSEWIADIEKRLANE